MTKTIMAKHKPKSKALLAKIKNGHIHICCFVSDLPQINIDNFDYLSARGYKLNLIDFTYYKD